ncbi:response regulator transcription factor [Alloscardovia venturai]|uniref:Response regulator transcription factor n=1 Tax=Alloscardovia venturai TaxID=1769421 RepID=A0ABW2Y4T3_9BIFI
MSPDLSIYTPREKVSPPLTPDVFHTKRILVVEDEAELQKLLLNILRRDGYIAVQAAGTVSHALELAKTWRPEAFLLDVMLPDGDGFELLRMIQKDNTSPALFLSARDEDEARLHGLGMGADDYITKPFLPQELLLRLNAVLRRTYTVPSVSHTVSIGSSQVNGAEHDLLTLGDVTIDFSTGIAHQVAQKNSQSMPKPIKDIPLTATELTILKILRDNRGIIVTTDSLMESVWGNSFGYENSLMVHMHRLRDKIEEDPSKPQWILTARGLGYRLAAPTAPSQTL